MMMAMDWMSPHKGIELVEVFGVWSIWHVNWREISVAEPINLSQQPSLAAAIFR